MDEQATRATARLLMLLAEFGQTVSGAMAEVAPAPELVGNAPLLVLGQLELEGPQRPHDLATLTGMTTGGLSKLLDRMEGFGTVSRQTGSVPDDHRAVLVSITDRGSEMLRLITLELHRRLPETRALVRAIVEIVEPRRSS